MFYTVIPTDKFNEDVKYYVKKKKFSKILNDIKTVTDELEKGNLIGDIIADLNIDTYHHTYKVRAVNSDTRAGKANGYRIIYYAIKDDKEIYLITIYYKKDDSRVPSNYEIAQMIKKYCI
jgi:mRNA-degrading endonuclease RelE of RelBE toxin-antitoxin system